MNQPDEPSVPCVAVSAVVTSADGKNADVIVLGFLPLPECTSRQVVADFVWERTQAAAFFLDYGDWDKSQAKTLIDNQWNEVEKCKQDNAKLGVLICAKYRFIL